MSMGQHYFDQMFLQDCNNEAVIAALVTQELWQTAEGEVLRICDMPTPHIEAVLGWLRKKDYYFRDDYLKLFSEALRDRVDDEFTVISEYYF